MRSTHKHRRGGAISRQVVGRSVSLVALTRMSWSLLTGPWVALVASSRGH